ncbi:hypothetical protein DN730_09645 [Marinomonas piezotolerans]|uniref:Rieske domain-containing protein n=1 Tax=Marinomonas piezotolerans TaxID=2213058 RepID=A0A370UA64_9GAMM|nr:Rieske (2Fe-2S) protein [Marinomonas piezotolerans]RDL44638.1 hypothetical protein DN730_09645 [Marinomonas piezotolerans]
MQTRLIKDLETIKKINALVDNEGIVLTLNDALDIIVIKNTNTLYAYRNLCPHLNKPLTNEEKAPLDESQTLLECAHHGAQFLLHNGQCVSGPCLTSHLEPIALAWTGQHYTLHLSDAVFVNNRHQNTNT